jgi:hypothetical protein
MAAEEELCEEAVHDVGDFEKTCKFSIFVSCFGAGACRSPA